jgi:hypothetical protein
MRALYQGFGSTAEPAERAEVFGFEKERTLRALRALRLI